MNEEELILLLDGTEDDALLWMSADEKDADDTWKDVKFNLDVLTDEECKKLFRFHKNDLLNLSQYLHIPEKVIGENGSHEKGIIALCMLLRRLSYPNRLYDLQYTFGRSESEISVILKATLNHLYDNFNHLLRRFDVMFMQQHHLDIYSRAIQDKCPLQNVFGFIDGTLRPICRPGHNQRESFSGHKRCHGLKFQSIMLPNGIIGNMFGPIEGRRHDSYMLRESGILPQLQNLPHRNNIPFALYGDPAYPLRPQLLCPFRGARITEVQQDFNTVMSSVRQCVEWGFGKITSLWAFLDFKQNLKILLQPVAKYYLVGALLTNCHTCLYGSQTGEYFGIDAPSIEEYLRL